MYGLSGPSRFGGGNLRILYAGTRPFFSYLNETAYAHEPDVQYLGAFTLFDLQRAGAEFPGDIEVVRSNKLMAAVGVYPERFFVPEWLTGVSSLNEQKISEDISRSRKRDRRLIERSKISFYVSRNHDDLDYFFKEMYMQHIPKVHGDSALLMTRDSMIETVDAGDGELVVIRMNGKPVGGSFIVYDGDQPRLYSEGVLNNDKELLRKGVGTAIYLCSFDYLAAQGFTSVHMGRSRALLSDGVLYFKQRFGLHITGCSLTGHFFKCTNPSNAAAAFLHNTGLIHFRGNRKSAASFVSDSLADPSDVLAEQQRQASDMGLDGVEVVDLSPQKQHSHSRISNVKVAQSDS